MMKNQRLIGVRDISGGREQIVGEGPGNSLLTGRQRCHQILAVEEIVLPVRVDRPESTGSGWHHAFELGRRDGFRDVGDKHLPVGLGGSADDGDGVTGRPEHLAVGLTDRTGFLFRTGETGGKDGDFTFFFGPDVQDVRGFNAAGAGHERGDGRGEKELLFHGRIGLVIPFDGIVIRVVQRAAQAEGLVHVQVHDTDHGGEILFHMFINRFLLHTASPRSRRRRS